MITAVNICTHLHFQMGSSQKQLLEIEFMKNDHVARNTILIGRPIIKNFIHTNYLVNIDLAKIIILSWEKMLYFQQCETPQNQNSLQVF